MPAKLLVYDGSKLSETIPSTRNMIRWMDWSANGDMAVAVGNYGRVLAYENARWKSLPCGYLENLRCVALNPVTNDAVIVGNNGLILRYRDGRFAIVKSEFHGNLRRAVWNPSGKFCLIVGNQGFAATVHDNEVKPIEGGSSNLRAACWVPSGEYALITANHYSTAFTPAPSLYMLRPGSESLEPVDHEMNADLTSISWRPRAGSALLVGYDLIWHKGMLFEWNGKSLEERLSTDEWRYFSCVAWDPRGKYALIGTGGSERRSETGFLLRYEDGRIHRIIGPSHFHVACIAWNPTRETAFIAGSPDARIFSV